MKKDIPPGWGVFQGGGKDDEPPPPEEGDPGPGEGGEEKADSDWKSKLLRSEKGNVLKCLSNAMHIVNDHPCIRERLAYDARRLSIVWLKAPPWGKEPRQYLDHDGGLAALWVADELGLPVDHKVIDYACLCSARKRPYDGVMDYLNSLEWDGGKRLENWLTTYLGVEQSRYSKAVGRAWMISAVARAVKPGCKADHMLILEGEQGAKKSSVLSALVGDDYFAELSIDVADKDSLMAIHGPWVIEWAELVGHNRRESEAVKGFISRRVDRFRVSYGRYTEDHPRSCIFVGTTNDERYLMDPTGGRRYWPVKVGSIDVEAVERDRGHLWAESVAAYRAGEPWWLDGVHEDDAIIEQYQRIEDDPWEYPIHAAIDMRYGNISVSEILDLIDVRVSAQNKTNSRRVYHIMQKLGWVVVSGDHEKVRVFNREKDQGEF